jgi:hypothetical protein
MLEAVAIGRFEDLSPPYLYALVETRRRHAALRQGDTPGLVTSEWLRTSRRFDVVTLAYCLLPDRIHVLATGAPGGGDPRAAVRRWKMLTGQAYRLRTGSSLWNEGRKEWALASLAEARETARYLVHAPVRAGLVQMPRQYRWVLVSCWSLDDLTGGSREPLRPCWWPEPLTSGCRNGYSPPR